MDIVHQTICMPSPSVGSHEMSLQIEMIRFVVLGFNATLTVKVVS